MNVKAVGGAAAGALAAGPLSQTIAEYLQRSYNQKHGVQMTPSEVTQQATEYIKPYSLWIAFGLATAGYLIGQKL